MPTRYIAVVKGTSDTRVPPDRTGALAAAIYVDSNDGYKLKVNQNGTLATIADSINGVTFTDATFVVDNSVDATKKVKFSLSGQTTAVTLTLASALTTTQTLTIPNITAADTLVTTNLAQTIKSKKLDSSNTEVDATDATKVWAASLSGMTTGVTLTWTSAQTTSQALTIPNISGADTLAVLSLAQRLLSKDLQDTTTTISNVSATSKAIGFALTGMTASVVLTLSSSQSTSQTLTIPNITGADTLVTQSFAQTLTNKIVNNQSFLMNTSGSASAQTPSATVRTYLTGSAISVPVGKLQIGTMLEWTFDMTKTGAGSAASTFDIAIGTNGTTGDAAVVSFTKPGGSGVIDTAWVTITCLIRGPLTGSCIAVGTFQMTHNLASTGHAVIPVVVVNTVSSGFDATVANLKVGICITTGASDVITIQGVQAYAQNL